MQNKGFVKVIGVLLTLACLFYLSFSWVTNHHESKAAAMGEEAGKAYLDSIKNEKIWLGQYTYAEAQNMQVSLGLDLKGGMNVIVEVSVADVLQALSGQSKDADFLAAVDVARQQTATQGGDFVGAFVKAYKAKKGDNRLKDVFATQALQGKVSTTSTDSQVESVLRTEVEAAIGNAYNVLRARIDRFGVAQPNIQRLEGQTGRIMVEMPGVKEPERVRKMLQGSANLEFWETYDPSVVAPLLTQLDGLLASGGATTADTTKATTADSDTANSADATVAALSKLKSSVTAQTAKPAVDTTAYAKNPLLSRLNVLAQGGLLAVAQAKDTAIINAMLNSPEAKGLLMPDLRLKWSVKPSEYFKGDIFELYALRASNSNGDPALSGDVIASAKADFDDKGRPCVNMQMNAFGTREWSRITEANAKKPVAVVLDGYVYSAPNINEKIPNGSSVITGSFTINDTKDLADVLSSGKMPAPTKIVQEEMVGPSLGAESIQAGMISCVVAFVVLMIFMCLYYGLIPGMVANVALLLNFFFTFGILTSFQAALTLSGIAGMVLTLGMAVDANVLIFERTKEELLAGKSLRQALTDGYGNAFSAIFDSNLTSIITAIILFNFGTGPIRGFATTLGIGIAVSFFTAVWITRLIFENRMNKDKWLGLTFTTKLSRGFLQGLSIDFMSKAKASYIAFATFVVVCLVSFGVRGLSQGIDFTGGRNFVIQFEQATKAEDVATALKAKVGDANVSAQALGTDGKTIRLTTNYKITSTDDNIDEEVEQFIHEALHEKGLIKANLATFINRDNHTGGSIVSSQKVGPSVASDMTTNAIISVVLSLAAIFVYILIRFRNVAFSVGSVGALVVDTVLIIGMFSLCWGWLPISLEVDQTFIGAVLTAIGYSINDKVVVFDRIRENLGLHPMRDPRQIFNDSLNSTLTRTIMTSFTTLLVLLIIFFLGGESIRAFAFAMILGVVFGTLSSIFLAAPIASTIFRKRAAKALRA